MNEHLSLTPAGLNLIQHFEGLHKQIGPDHYKAYSCPAGVPTIGVGTTRWNGKPITLDMIWSKNQCDQAFLKDIEQQERDVRRLVQVGLQPWEFDALVSFVYNVGPGAFANSTLLRKLNQGNFEGAALEFHRWNKAGGKVLPGLVRRRASEALLFQNLPDENYDGVADDIMPSEDPMPQHVDIPL